MPTPDAPAEPSLRPQVRPRTHRSHREHTARRRQRRTAPVRSSTRADLGWAPGSRPRPSRGSCSWATGRAAASCSRSSRRCSPPGSRSGPARSVLGRAYATLVAPRLAPPAEREDPRPPRFAQTVGLVISGTGLVLALLGVPGALVVAAALAFAAAFLNAAFGLCLGCELYLVITRLRAR